MKHILLAVLLLSASGVRADLEEEVLNREPAQRPVRQAQPRPAPQPQPSAQQPVQQGPVFQQEDLFEQLRTLSGRIDVVENQITMLNAAQAGEKDGVNKEKQAIELKFVAYEDALKKLEAQVQALSDELSKIKLARATPAKAEKSAKPESRNPHKAYEDGEALFKDKKYKEAILAYEKYRSSNAKGKYYADATYKMGVCFQEVGMKDEAIVFFEEVISKFPKSKEAKKASGRVKQLK